VLASLTAILLGTVLGIRHAFEPDHLTAVSTLVLETRSPARGAVLGAIWGLGHSLSLVVLGSVLVVSGSMLSPAAMAAFELGVAGMLVVLGVRSLVRAGREGTGGAVRSHRHRGCEHVHRGPQAHLHVGRRAFAVRPFVVGLVHGLAGTGAITAIVFAELPTLGMRVTYMALFGLGSVAGMAAATGAAGASLHRFAATPGRRRMVTVASGVGSIVLGIAWAIPELAAL
jgi:hypothetical protein